MRPVELPHRRHDHAAGLFVRWEGNYGPNSRANLERWSASESYQKWVSTLSPLERAYVRCSPYNMVHALGIRYMSGNSYDGQTGPRMISRRGKAHLPRHKVLARLCRMRGIPPEFIENRWG